MENEKTFKTKLGFCHILPDKIILTKDGIIGNISETVIGNNITKILIRHGLFSIGSFYFSYTTYKNNQPLLAGSMLLLGIFMTYGIFVSLNNSTTPIILRNQIKKVVLKKANGFTRTYFEIYFEDENSKIKKRLIMLPGSLTNGKEETEKAIKLFSEEGLLKDNL